LIPYNPGDPVPEGKQVVTVIGDDGVPRSYLMDIPVPLSGLVKTGDDSASVLQLTFTMLAAFGMSAAVVYKKRKES